MVVQTCEFNPTNRKIRETGLARSKLPSNKFSVIRVYQWMALQNNTKEKIIGTPRMGLTLSCCGQDQKEM